MVVWLDPTISTDGAVAADGLQERRAPRFVRISSQLPAVLVDATSGRAVHGRVENLGVGGMYFSGTDALEVGAHVLCALIRTDGAYQDEFHTNGTVVHRNGHGVGIAFEEVTPFAFTLIHELMEAEGCFSVRLEMAPERATRFGRGRR